MNEHYDYIVVGGGAAGCIVAKQLAKRSNANILLIEAGDNGVDDRFRIPSIENLFKTWFTDADWQIKTTPQRGLNDREITINQGKVLGGGAAINALMYVRGNKLNFEEWFRISGGDRNWSPENFEKYFKELESFNIDNLDNSFTRGNNGPISILKTPNPSFSSTAFIKGCVENGYLQGDFNGEKQNEIVDYMQLIINKNGERCSTYRAFIEGIIPKNLTIKCLSEVKRLIIKDEKCNGVVLKDNQQINADKVVLCSGALSTPKILFNSGIADPVELEKFGIQCTAENKFIGKNLSDHLRVMIAYESEIDPGNTEFLCEAALFTRSFLQESNEVDLQINFSAGVQGFVPDEFIPEKGLSNSVIFVPVLARPTSKGNISIKEMINGECLVNIDPNYLGNELDLEIYKKGVDICRKIAESMAMKEYCKTELCPGRNENVEDYLKNYASTIWHPVGTCSIGDSYKNSACSPDFKLRGINDLYIVDASVIPTLPSGNPQASIFALSMIASEVLAK